MDDDPAARHTAEGPGARLGTAGYCALIGLLGLILVAAMVGTG